jgi:UDP-glucose 6-dehydrogenase
MNRHCVLILGLGAVGKTFQQFLEEKHFLSVDGYDPKTDSPETLAGKIKNCHSCFLCLPTDLDKTTFSYDTNPLVNTLEYLQEMNYKDAVIIRSTTSIGFVDDMQLRFKNLHLFHFPEFLSEQTKEFDMKHPKQILVGYSKHNHNASLIQRTYSLLNTIYPNINITIHHTEITESVKVVSNVFYAYKLFFFQHLFDICKKKNLPYSTIVQLMIQQCKWIEPIHTFVFSDSPSIDGKCLPKDTMSFYSWCSRENLPLEFLKPLFHEFYEKIKDK